MSSEDEDEELEKRLQSCTVETSLFLNGSKAASDAKAHESQLKLCQVRVYDQLRDFLDKTLEFVENDAEAEVENGEEGESSFQLFRNAAPGISFKQTIEEEVVEMAKRRKPWRHAVKRWKVDPLSRKAALEASAVDGESIMENGRRAAQKALAEWRGNLAKREEAIAKEEERIALLKKQRGEKWLPSLRVDATAQGKKKRKNKG